MKTLEELAEEYLETAESLKKKINELKRRDPGINPAAIHKTIDTYEQMYSEAIMNYHRLKNYYKKYPLPSLQFCRLLFYINI
ncbi:MAG: hypothetical protein IK955_08720 [Clostridia bacterium]|nr:hypothetical protein [Clostridia bacterium]